MKCEYFPHTKILFSLVDMNGMSMRDSIPHLHPHRYSFNDLYIEYIISYLNVQIFIYVLFRKL